MDTSKLSILFCMGALFAWVLFMLWIFLTVFARLIDIPAIGICLTALLLLCALGTFITIFIDMARS